MSIQSFKQCTPWISWMNYHTCIFIKSLDVGPGKGHFPLFLMSSLLCFSRRPLSVWIYTTLDQSFIVSGYDKSWTNHFVTKIWLPAHCAFSFSVGLDIYQKRFRYFYSRDNLFKKWIYKSGEKSVHTWRKWSKFWQILLKTDFNESRVRTLILTDDEILNSRNNFIHT